MGSGGMWWCEVGERKTIDQQERTGESRGEARLEFGGPRKRMSILFRNSRLGRNAEFEFPGSLDSPEEIANPPNEPPRNVRELVTPAILPQPVDSRANFPLTRCVSKRSVCIRTTRKFKKLSIFRIPAPAPLTGGRQRHLSCNRFATIRGGLKGSSKDAPKKR